MQLVIVPPRGRELHGPAAGSPAGGVAESQEAPEVLEAFDRRQRRVRPPVAERAQGRDVELLEQGEARLAAERQQLALDQLAPLRLS
jgi:hypothetical protein